MKKRYYLPLIALLSTSLFAQKSSPFNQGNIEQKDYFQKIPYRSVKGKIIVAVSINGKIYHFLLDTGAPMALSPKLCRELNLSTIDRGLLIDQSQTKDSTGLIILPQLNIAGLSFMNTPGVILPEASVQVFSCFGIDGIIGSNMLRNSILQFDARNSQVVITDNPKNLELKKKPFLPMALSEEQSDPRIKVLLKKDNKALSDQISFDSGDEGFYEMSAMAYNYFREHSDVIDKLAEGEGGFSWGLNGFAKGQHQFALNIPEFIINEITFSNIYASTTSGPASRIGTALLDYGKVTLDYRNKRFYFEPYETIRNEKLSRRDWGFLMTINNNKMVVGIIWDKALEKEMNTGDEVLQFDSVDYSAMNFCDLMTSGVSSSGENTTVLLKDVKTGEIKRVAIKRL